MELILGLGCAALVVGVPVWLVLKSLAVARQQNALAAYAYELENWEADGSTEFMSITYRANFPTMRFEVRGYTTDGLGVDDRSVFILRRTKKGVWQTKPTSETNRQTMLDLRRRIEQRAIFWKEAETDLAELERDGPKWQSLNEELTPSLETAYQRYLHSFGAPLAPKEAPRNALRERPAESRVEKKIRKPRAKARRPATADVVLFTCRCGTKNPNTLRFCEGCGLPVE